jgi:hypothetical protein
VERVDYANALVFEASDRDELLEYLRFKLPFVAPDWAPGQELPGPLEEAVRASLSRDGRVVLAKDDAAFRCWRPQCR